MEAVQYAAWVGTAGLSREDAMRDYIDLVSEKDSSFLFDNEPAEKAETDKPKHPLSTAAESIFDAVRDGADLAGFLPHDANQTDETGMSPLHLAVDMEQIEAVRALLAAGAKTDAVDAQRSTPLHYAALLGSDELVTLLLSHGAEALAKDEDGKTASTLARGEGHSALADRLLVAMAEPAREDGLLPGRLPIIDLQDFIDGSFEQRATIASHFDAAFCSMGFCQIRGYEALLSDEAIGALRTESAAFFAQPLDVKRHSHVDGGLGFLLSPLSHSHPSPTLTPLPSIQPHGRHSPLTSDGPSYRLRCGRLPRARRGDSDGLGRGGAFRSARPGRVHQPAGIPGGWSAVAWRR